VVHRDDREAMRARLEAMERQLADAREETEAARAEAAAAREAAERAAQPPPPQPSKRKEKKEKKKRKRAREAAEEAAAPIAPGRRTWTPRQRWTFAILSGLLCLTAYALPTPWVPDLAAGDDQTFFAVTMGSTVAVIVGHALLAWLLRAPSGIGPPLGLSTVAGFLPILGLVLLAPLEVYDFVPTGGREIARALGTGAAVLVGAIAVAAFITNAASES
jgi:hypothetical protein